MSNLNIWKTEIFQIYLKKNNFNIVPKHKRIVNIFLCLGTIHIMKCYDKEVDSSYSIINRIRYKLYN